MAPPPKKEHNTIHLLILTRHITEQNLQQNKYSILIQIDLSLAFDTIETNKILPGKLLHYGGNQTTIKFFKSFFNDRSHYTEWKGTTSKKVNLFNYSCIQGSTITANTYNFYTHDLQYVCDYNCNTITYADDTNIILSDQDPNKLIQRANEQLTKLEKYMTANNLMINKNKTTYIIFQPKSNKKVNITEKVKMNGTEIKRVTESKYLGIWIDEKLTFKTQVSKLKQKLTQTVKALICTRKILNYRAKMALYNGMFKANIEYGAVTYFDKISKKQLEQIKKLQKQAVRVIFNAKKMFTPTNSYNYQT